MLRTLVTLTLAVVAVSQDAAVRSRPLPKPLKLHLGCNFRDFGPEWVHIDGAIFPHIHSHNVTALPFANGSVSLIYASHLFAYFDRDEAPAVLAEWKRVMAPGGTLRLAVPDFGAVAQLYAKGSVGLDTFVSMLYGKWSVGNAAPGTPPIYHRTAYDEASLTRVLEDSGFSGVAAWDWRHVEHGQFDDYSQAYWPHMAKDTGTLVSLNLEATKPRSSEAGSEL